MARWFRGRGLYQGNINCYFDTIKVAPEDCGKKFLAGDEYTNYITGDVFLCKKAMTVPTKRGYIDAQDTWKYLRTDVIMKPWTKVTGLSIARKGNAYTVSWKVPSYTTDKKRNDRPNKVIVNLVIYGPDNRRRGTLYSSTNRGIGLGTTKITANLTRNSWYPYKTPMSTMTIGYLLAEVSLANDYGYRDTVTARYNFGAPRKPSIGAITQNANTGVLSAKIDTNKGEDQYERHDTFYAWTIYNSASKTQQRGEASQTSTSFTTNRDVPDRQQISYGNYIKATLGAYARGVMGNSEVAVRTYVMSFPNKPTINVPKITREPNAGRVVFGVSTNVDKAGNFPVTGVRLQKLVSVDYDSAADIPANADWQNAGPQDNGACTAMSIDLADLLPEAGKRTWVRLKTWNDIEAIFYRYSDPKRLTDIETPAPVTPTAGDDNATILSCKAGDDGTSAQLLVAWDPTTGTDDSNWTEVSWATNQRSWRSTVQPKTFAFADQSWNEGQVTGGGKTYRKSAHVDVMDLEPGQKYFIAARRMLKPENGDATYGPYSTKVTITPSDLTEAPESVTLSADGSAIRGEAIPLSWTYNGTAVQQSWSVRKMVGNSKSASDIVLARGNDERMFFNLPYYRNEARTSTIAASTASSISLYVECKIANVYVESEPFKVILLDRPSLEVSTQEVLMTQPVLASAFTNDPNTTVSLVVESDGGTSGSGPDGDISQSDGDTIWSGTVTPDWQVVSSIAEQTAVQEAKDALDSAQEAYDEVMGQYEEAKGRYDDDTSQISILTQKVADETRDLADATEELGEYQDILDVMDSDDPMYEAAAKNVESATAKVQELGDMLSEDTQALADATAGQSQAEDDMDAIDYSDEQAALESAISAYATAVASAVAPMDASEVTHRAIIQLPEGLNLLDNGRYKVRAFATDTSTGISSLDDTSGFVVSWSHQAPVPSPEIAIDSFDSTDENGKRTIGATIELAPPIRALASDTYDIYRISRDGAHLAIAGVGQDSTVIDRFATFADVQNGYVIASRTADGDIDWLEYRYFLPVSDRPFYSMVRIDWEGSYVELEHNVSPSDRFEKDFVSHKHLDGSVSGHWNRGVMRTLNISAAIIRGYEVQQEELLRSLARYDGPCLVRTTDGLFVEGNVSVDAISFGSGTVKGDVSLTVTEITPTGTFAPSIADEGEQEAVEEEEEEMTEEESDGGLL